MNMIKSILICVNTKITAIWSTPKSMLEYVKRAQSCKEKMAIMPKEFNNI